MFVIQDGRESFYQWDIDRKLIVEDSSIKEVHFCNKTEECSLVCATYQENGETLVNVPNILLQNDWKINVYGYTGDYTKHSDCFKVVKRSKPSDYVYTETEILNYQTLEAQLYNKVDYETFKNELTSALLAYPSFDTLNSAIFDYAQKEGLVDYTGLQEELETQFEDKDYLPRADIYKVVEEYELATESTTRSMIDNSLNDYATKAEVNALHNPLIVTVKGGETNGNVTSATNQEIFEAVQAGREVYLCLWSGSAYVRATYATATVAWFEASFLSSETINGKAYNCVKYRVFIIEKDKFKQSSLSIPKVDYVADLEKRVAALEAKLA